jgi:hypothetical protein
MYTLSNSYENNQLDGNMVSYKLFQFTYKHKVDALKLIK